MKHFNLGLLFLSLFFCCVAFSVNAQQAILNKVNQQAFEFSKAKTIQPFSQVLGNQLPEPISTKILKEKQVLKLNKQSVKNLKRKTEANIKLAFNINDEPILLKLFEVDIFSDNFKAATSTLTSRNNFNIEKGLHYWGVVDGKENSLTCISFFNNEVSGFIAYGGNTYLLGKMKNQEYHVLYKNTDLNFNNNFTCNVQLPANGVEKQIQQQVSQKKSATIYCVDIHIEADYDLYLDLGSSVNSTTNYVNGLMAQCIIQFANDNIDIQVSYINVWTNTSPYDAASADVGIMLDELRNYGWGQTNGNLVHLITTIGGGGVAYLDVLCNNSNYNTGVSNVYTNFNNVPVYSWDVNVVTHELGHNLASPHTHDCAWNGNNTAIDDCGYNYSGGTDGCDGPTPAAGTIMSYCHLYGAIGVDFTLGFGPQPKSLIVSTINNQFCLSNCAAPTCTDGILNGNEQGIDCGGDCLPCPDEICDDINFNNYNIVSYADQDNGTATINSGGTEIYITGNAWKAIAYPVTITPATVISFDFKSTIQGEIHEIAFDSDLTFDREQSMVVYGSQGYAGTLTNATYNGSGNWQTFTVDLGSQVTGTYNYLIFTCDDDANATGNSYFRNIKIWEDYNDDLECNTSASCATVNLDIFFDSFPSQTSWNIQDNNGNVMLDSNGNYSTQNANTSINSQIGCLADGCYTFNMYDALNNGMCPFQSSGIGASTFITPGTLITSGSVVGTLSLVSSPGLCGNYQLTNAAGETLASGGGSFGSTQSTSFCLSGGMLLRNTPKNVNDDNNLSKLGLLFELEPNVSNASINILLDATTQHATLNIYDVNGKQVEVLNNINNTEILKLDVSNYKAGTYFIQLINNENSSIKTFLKY